jgi:transcriptional regulator with XRE-family HTH domain
LKTLGELLRELREQKGLLLRQVAAAIEVDTAMISKFEKGERKPTRDQLKGLSKALGANEAEITILYLSERVVHDLKDESYAKEALKEAEKKIDFLNKKIKK